MSDLTPLTREEYYLARMAGEDVEVPDPITREEEYMKGIAAQIEAGSAELPAVTDEDEGKSLVVNSNGKWAAENLVPVSDDTGLLFGSKNGKISKITRAQIGNGNVFGVSSTGIWTPYQGLPNIFSNSDIGKVLTVGEDKKWKADYIPYPLYPLQPVGWTKTFDGTKPVTDDMWEGIWGDGQNMRLLVVIQIEDPTSNKESTSIGILKHNLNKYIEPIAKPLLIDFWNGASGNENSYPISELISDVTYEYNENTQHYTTYTFTPAEGASSKCNNNTRLQLYKLF